MTDGTSIRRRFRLIRADEALVREFRWALKEVMMLNEWNLAETGRQIGESPSVISQWLKGASAPRELTMYELDSLLRLKLFSHDEVSDDYYRWRGRTTG